MANNDWWDYIAQCDETGNYIAHYGVKGMKWSKRSVGTASIKPSYFLSSASGNNLVAVNPNANRFRVSVNNYPSNGTKNDRYLQVDYNRGKVKTAKKKVKSTATRAKNLINRLRYGR